MALVYVVTLDSGDRLLQGARLVPRQGDIVIKKHDEAIFGSVAGIPPTHFYGPSTLSKNKDILYLFIPHKPNGPIVIKGLKNEINRIRIVGDGTKLTWKVMMKQYWSATPGLLYIDVPVDKLDKYITVIAVQLKGEIDLYEGEGNIIDSN